MNGLRRAVGRLRNRRGAALVLIAIMMTVMIGMVGASVDFARMYAFKAQVQVTADAAALAGAIELVNNRNNNLIPDTSIKYADPNRVNGNYVVTVDADSVQPVHWDFDTHTWTLQSWGNSNTNAVRVSARYDAPYTFGKIFGATTSTLGGEAIAAVGYAGSTNCLKPWAVSYQTMLDNLFGAGTKDALTYDLTAADVNTLTANAAPLPLLMNNSTATTAGNIQQVVVNNPWNGNNSYKAAISGACANMEIGPGTILDGDPGVGSGQTGGSLKDFCVANGGVVMSGNDFTCTGAPKVKLVIWDWMNSLPGGNFKVRVKYVGVFAVTGFSKLPGGNEQITGYFSSMADPGGSFSSTPGPLTGKAILTL